VARLAAPKDRDARVDGKDEALQQMGNTMHLLPGIGIPSRSFYRLAVVQLIVGEHDRHRHPAEGHGDARPPVRPLAGRAEGGPALGSAPAGSALSGTDAGRHATGTRRQRRPVTDHRDVTAHWGENPHPPRPIELPDRDWPVRQVAAALPAAARALKRLRN
jgi:hypothetical protein